MDVYMTKSLLILYFYLTDSSYDGNSALSYKFRYVFG